MIVIQLLPGLPVSSLMFVCPLTAALFLVYREDRAAGVSELLKRSFDYTRISAKIWYAPIILLEPGVMALSYGLMHLMGVPLPAPQFTVLAALALVLTFFIAALGEEIGWSGYVIDPMQDRWARSTPPFSWGWWGPVGTSYHCCRFTDRQRGSRDGVLKPWQNGS